MFVLKSPFSICLAWFTHFALYLFKQSDSRLKENPSLVEVKGEPLNRLPSREYNSFPTVYLAFSLGAFYADFLGVPLGKIPLEINQELSLPLLAAWISVPADLCVVRNTAYTVTILSVGFA